MADASATNHVPTPQIPQNPLVTARTAGGLQPLDQRPSSNPVPLTVIQMARYLGTTKSLVQFAEQGCYRKIPPPYFRAGAVDNYVAPELYHKFRLAKRQRTATQLTFPVDPPQTFALLLDFLDLNPYQFACRLCVQPSEVQKLTSRVKQRLPLNLQEALIQIGLPWEWVKELEKNLKEAP